jgi:hypothetical protein
MNIIIHASTPQEAIEEVLAILENMRWSYNKSASRARQPPRQRNDALSSEHAIAAAINLIRDVQIMPNEDRPSRISGAASGAAP